MASEVCVLLLLCLFRANQIISRSEFSALSPTLVTKSNCMKILLSYMSTHFAIIFSITPVTYLSYTFIFNLLDG